MLSKLPKWLIVSAGITAAIFIAINVVIGWLVSNKLMAINPQTVAYDQTITAIQGSRYTISGSAYNIDGVVGGIRSDGSMFGIYGAPLSLNDKTKTSTRIIDDSAH